jgi:hypothetical protein
VISCHCNCLSIFTSTFSTFYDSAVQAWICSAVVEAEEEITKLSSILLVSLLRNNDDYKNCFIVKMLSIT